MVFHTGQPLRPRYTRYTQDRWPVLKTSLVTPSSPLFWADEQWHLPVRTGEPAPLNATRQAGPPPLSSPKPQTSRCMTGGMKPNRSLGPISRQDPASPCHLAAWHTRHLLRRTHKPKGIGQCGRFFCNGAFWCNHVTGRNPGKVSPCSPPRPASGVRMPGGSAQQH